MKQRRKDRWFSLIELATLLEPHHPRLVAMSRPTKRKFIYRLVRSLERKDGRQYARRQGRDLYVSKLALENLLPAGHVRAIDSLEENQEKIASELRRVRRQVNDHGRRVSILEKKQKLTTEYLRNIAEVN